jgi:hypothetical protein
VAKRRLRAHILPSLNLRIAREWLTYGVGVASVTSSVDGGPIVILPAIISPVKVT